MVNSKNTPILKHIIVVQILCLSIAVSLSILCFFYFKKANIDAYYNKTMDNIRSTIEKRQKDWLFWYHFGLTEALDRDIDTYLHRLPLKSIKIVQHPPIVYPKTGSIILSSQELMLDFPYAIVAELDFDRENIIAGKKIGVFTLIVICSLFLFTSFYLVAFIKKSIFKPMLHLIEAFEHLNRTGRLAISDVGIKGEMKEFVTGIMAIYQKMKLSEKKAAVIKTTQMLAHDVRKPFSMLISILRLLQQCEDPEKIRKIASEYTPHVKKSITSVDNMLEEILKMGLQDKIIQKPCCLGSIIKASIDEVSYAHPNADVKLIYHFNHTRLIHADALKIQRVFSNIFGNAVQAMDNRGSVWFKTHDSDDKSFVTCRIGNTGSYIQEEDLPHVFDMFYSKNKRKGTGLGLAICHNIIIAHGGEIWCESTLHKRIVEFSFTLPATSNDMDIKETLLASNIQNCIINLNQEKTEVGRTSFYTPFLGPALRNKKIC